MLVMVGAGCAGGQQRAAPVVPPDTVADAALTPAECGRLVEHIFATTFREASPAARAAARESEWVRMTMNRMRQLCDADMPRPVYQCFMSAESRFEVQACTRRFGPTKPERPIPRPGEVEA